ncbi:alpha-L-rhamnosidase [Microbacterium terricola]|uniref:alpha-L-rhamnosidase n=1 Tax=Microbacterium terricola TaxID=344163 RepID=A0ABM8E200_9MICO|nr:alpha-L-rhamnosidase [Microbacterium terricola]UYK40471.1 glycoside hydrolase family 78 protein [Microbacterium terricola]BDV31806.1 alpha-L-rhamnosidase [Microbacterium terricola]
MSAPECRDLRVEYARAPLAVATDAPRFTWTVAHTQVAARIVVSDAAGNAVWDTGRLAGAGTSLIPYAGEPLASNADYGWTVESWSADGGRATAASIFGTALLRASDWTAARWVEPTQQPTALERWSLLDWIRGAAGDTPPEDRLRPVQLLRQTVRLDAAPLRARLFATAEGVYTASVNGAEVGDEVLAPGFDSYAHRISVQCYDVTDQLVAGENVVGIALADGWWAGRIGITGSSAQFGDRTAALWQLHLDLADGTSRVIGSGDAARSAPGPWRYADLFVGECFDARAVPRGWDAVGFDDAGWTPVAVRDGIPDRLVPFAGEPMRRVAELPAVTSRETAGGTVVDFGQVIAGRVRLRLTGAAAGDRVTIEHTETLDAQGEWFDNIRGINKEQTDVYVAAGGDEVYEPAFTFHGFRYARVSGAAGFEATAIVIASDLEQTGTFTTSDARLNRLHENVVWSQRGNFVSIPTDCPQREKVGWTGDAQVFAPAATNNAQVVPFLSRWLANLRADQLPDGAVPITSPRSPFDVEAAASATGLGGIEWAAGWSDAIVFVPWTLYERTGDVRVLEENVDAILRWVDFQAGATGDQFGDWLTPSTLEGLPPHEGMAVAPRLTGELVVPMFRAQSLTLAARITAVLGRDDEAADLARRAAAARAAFADEHLDEAGDLPVQLQGVYVLALAFDMVPDAVRARTAARLVELVRARGDRLDTGFLSVPYLLDVLWESGHRDLARTLLWQSEMPSWLYEVDAGATTIWESWDAVASDGTPRPVSLNHYAFGCVDDWLYRRVAGIQAAAPGYRAARIEPDFDAGLTHVSASVATPAGRLAVEWTREGDTATISCTVPHGVTATLEAAGRSIPLPAGQSTVAVALAD